MEAERERKEEGNKRTANSEEEWRVTSYLEEQEEDCVEK